MSRSIPFATLATSSIWHDRLTHALATSSIWYDRLTHVSNSIIHKTLAMHYINIINPSLHSSHSIYDSCEVSKSHIAFELIYFITILFLHFKAILNILKDRFVRFVLILFNYIIGLQFS